MLTDRIRPPARLGRHIADEAAPFGSSDPRAVAAVEGHHTLIGIKIRDGTQ
jgi:hypothetical protein